jgi:hypothetical protein
MDSGSGFTTVENSFVLTKTNTGLTSGNTYTLRVSARNIHGTGLPSPIVTVLAATEPDVPTNVQTVDNGVTVRITWDAPVNTGGTGVTIDGYQIVVLESDLSTYTEDVINCDGTDVTILANRYCDIPMSVFTSSPYSLTQGDTILAKVKALNSIGWSGLSSVSTTTTDVEVVPHKPTNPPTRDATTDSTQLVVNWSSLSSPEDGDSAVLSYSLEYDDASAGAIWTKLIGFSSDSLLTTFTVSTSVTAGEIYLFRYRAKNIHGWGEYSDNV